MRKIAQYSLILCGLLLVVTCSVFLHERNQRVQVTDSNASKSNNILISSPPCGQINMLLKWKVAENKEMTCVVRDSSKENVAQERTVTFMVINESGLTVYQEEYTNVNRMYLSYALRRLFPQLVIETDGGGSSEFIQVFSYDEEKNKVISLITENAEFNSFAEVRPLFNGKRTLSKEPFVIFLGNRASGLASPGTTETSIYKFNGRAYQKVGNFAQEKIDELIEGTSR